MILVDTNVAIDALDPASRYHDWAAPALQKAIGQGGFLNHVVTAELAARAKTMDRLKDMLTALDMPIEPLDLATAFRAGRAFVQWIENGGRRGGLLPDFLIGAHATTRGAAVLTRDTRRFMAYFPELILITPETHP